MPTHRYPEQEEEHTHDGGPDRSGRPGKQRYEIVNVNQERVTDKKESMQKAGQEAGNARPVKPGSPGAKI